MRTFIFGHVVYSSMTLVFLLCCETLSCLAFLYRFSLFYRIGPQMPLSVFWKRNIFDFISTEASSSPCCYGPSLFWLFIPQSQSETLKVLISLQQFFPLSSTLQPVSLYYLSQSLQHSCFPQFHHLFSSLSISLTWKRMTDAGLLLQEWICSHLSLF